ncbi:MAG: signal peptidase II [Gammaproteobacteria bacterium]|nr:signal peptidase II [Gammaproteobacteria bacterium]
MDKSLPRFSGYLAVVLMVIAVDQGTKQIAFQNLQGTPPIDVLPVLQWTLVTNRGAAFGFLNAAGGSQHYYFSVLAGVVSIVLVIWLWRCFMDNRLLAWSLVLILAGAVGNLVDRLRYQYVIDFISFHYQHWYFPAFNIADSAITVGAILFIADSLGMGRGRPDRTPGD